MIRYTAACVGQRRWFVFASVMLVVHGAYCASDVHAGGGPENVLLVVNARSPASNSIANYYIELRRIPLTNVLYVDFPDSNERIDARTFREKLLAPVLRSVAQRSLGGQIDYVVYSADFPWSIDFREDFPNRRAGAAETPVGSLTGVTFLWKLLTDRDARIFRLDANHYYQVDSGNAPPGSWGFRSWYGWGLNGERLEAGGDQYVLSTMLTVTSGRGLSVEEAIAGLSSSAVADGCQPSGTIYFMKNLDIRSTTRDPLFARASAAISQIGVHAEVIDGELPLAKGDVAGCMTGAETLDWTRTRSSVRPGAISENLTSLGGDLSYAAAQSSCIAHLRHGAAGSSGTVVEPLAIAQKFPSAWMHLHYARGHSLAESFYQATSNPYQLLVVGDPLCQPWAKAPLVDVGGLPGEQVVSGKIQLLPRAKATGDIPVERYEWFVDGVRRGTAQLGEPFEIDTTLLVDGFHELRVVAIEKGARETQGRLIAPILVDNRGHQVSWVSEPGPDVKWGEPIHLIARSAGADRIMFVQGTRELARVRPGEKLTLDPRVLGFGPVVIRAAALRSQGPDRGVWSRPMRLNVTPVAVEAEVMPNDAMVPGLKLLRDDGSTAAVTDFADEGWLESASVKPNQGFKMTGWIKVDEPGVHQLQLRHAGPLVVRWNGEVIYNRNAAGLEYAYALVAPEEGPHRLELTGRAVDPVGFDVRFGLRGTRPLDESFVEHARE